MIYKYLENLDKNNKMVQSFLICNTKLEIIKEELLDSINKVIFKSEKSIENNPDIYILDNNDGNISKDNIKNLLKQISTTSQFNNKKVYIIDECEKLNEFVSNSLLKTLEEPQENIYAFLISSNVNMVKDTIVSRCHKILVSSEFDENIDNSNVENISREILKYLGNNFNSCFNYILIENNEVLLETMKYMLDQHLKMLKENIESNKITEDEVIINRIITINNNISRLSNNKNLNKNLNIDRFLIEMSGVK